MRIGGGRFDPRTGKLEQLAGLDVEGPQLTLWRAPVDNDRPFAWKAIEPAWRVLGLHRLTERVDAVAVGPEGMEVRTRIAPAATDLGMVAVARWSADG